MSVLLPRSSLPGDSVFIEGGLFFVHFSEGGSCWWYSTCSRGSRTCGQFARRFVLRFFFLELQKLENRIDPFGSAADDQASDERVPLGLDISFAEQRVQHL